MLLDIMWQIIYQQNLCLTVFKDYLLALGLLQNHTVTPDTDFKATRWYVHSMFWKSHISKTGTLLGGVPQRVRILSQTGADGKIEIYIICKQDLLSSQQCCSTFTPFSMWQSILGKYLSVGQRTVLPLRGQIFISKL
jgi:hypothetical protein